jgi:hypothetical protein
MINLSKIIPIIVDIEADKTSAIRKGIPIAA